ncbi:PAS domain S-box protein [Bacteroidota bacterium]
MKKINKLKKTSKADEKKIIEQQLLLHPNLLNAIEQAVIVTKPDGEIIYWNPFAEKMYGWISDEVIGQNIMNITVPQLSHERAEEIMKNLGAGQSWSGEFQVQRKDGSIFPIFITDLPVINKKKDLISIMGISIDINEKKKQEEALLESENRFRSMFENHNAVMMLIDPGSGKIIDSNHSAAEFYGYSRKELASMNIEDINTLSSKKIKKKRKLANAQDVNSFDFKHRLKSKAIRDVHVHSTPIEYMSQNLLFSIIYDITERKLAEDKIKSTKDFYEHIIEGVQDGIWVTDKNDEIFYANESMAKIAGIPKNKISGNNVLKDFPEETTKEFNVFYRKAKKELKPTWYETKVKTPAGKDTYQNGWLIPRTKDGEYEGMICTTRNVTEKKKAEEALIENEEKYRLLHENAGLGIGYYTPEGIVISFNSIAAKHLNGVPEDFAGKSIYELFPKDGASIYFDRIQKAINSDKNMVYEDCIQLPNEEKWFLSTFTKIVNFEKEVLGVQIISQDITKQKLTENNLKTSEEKYRKLVETASDAIYLMNDQGFIVDSNQQASVMLQKSKNEIIGSSIENIDPNFPREEFIEFWRNTPYDEQRVFETTHQQKDGTLIPVEVSGKKFMHNDKTSFFGIARDISERKKTEEALKRSEDNIYRSIVSSEEKERERYAKELHDGLGPILSTGMIYLHTLLEEDNQEKQKEYIERTSSLLEEAIESIREITNNLSPDILRKYGLVQAVRSFIEKLKNVSNIKCVIHSNLSERLPDIIAITLYRSIIELINNSIRHAEAKKISINFRHEKQGLKVSYTDDGKGFNYQKVRKEDTGFGLMNIESRINKIGGKYSYITSPGKGIKVEIAIQKI